MIIHEILSIDARPLKHTIAHNANSLKENYQISSAKLVSEKADAGQKIAEKGEVLSPSTLVQSLGPDDLAAVHVDDFRPTTPGNSPRIGHSFTREKDVEPKETDGGYRHVVAAARNDFRPTEPGHSPGVGHSFEDKVTAGPNS
ncbi:precursor of CEP9-like [Syzygium oleosum]|uniref:precursor of CEP9-like n=1 Tax=Syzygium oleosum TaxID=219896 RepID=UPI0011D1A45E|nr:precursor of CEP9-like [Syzygium oleosum]